MQSAVGDQNFVDYSLLIEVSDGTLSTSKDFSIRIYQANTAPRFEDSAGNVLEVLTLELEEDFSTSDWQQKLSGLVFER